MCGQARFRVGSGAFGMSEDKDVARLMGLAERARFHARQLTDHTAITALKRYAEKLEQQALRLTMERAAKPGEVINIPTGEPANRPELAIGNSPKTRGNGPSEPN